MQDSSKLEQSATQVERTLAVSCSSMSMTDPKLEWTVVSFVEDKTRMLSRVARRRSRKSQVEKEAQAGATKGRSS